MKRWHWYAVVAVAELVAWRAGLAAFTVTTLILGGVYWASLRLNPRVPHRGCGGRGFFPGRFFTWASHKCTGCSGGLLVRRGARVAGTAPVRGEWQRYRGATRTR